MSYLFFAGIKLTDEVRMHVSQRARHFFFDFIFQKIFKFIFNFYFLRNVRKFQTKMPRLNNLVVSRNHFTSSNTFQSYYVRLHRLCTPASKQLILFFLIDPIKLCHIRWKLSITCYHQVLFNHTDWITLSCNNSRSVLVVCFRSLSCWEGC